jgi:aminoglycoside 6'-N-acetyltransferase
MACLPTSIVTKRLKLRRYQPDDAAWYAAMALANRDHLARYESGNACMGIEGEASARIALEGFARDTDAGVGTYLGAFRRSDGAFVAQVYIGVTDATLPGYLVGYFCERSHLRQGYVSEAVAATVDALFAEGGALRVGLWCDDTNLASRAIAERLGMTLEGHVRADKRNADGSVTGSCAYGLLADEWRRR